MWWRSGPGGQRSSYSTEVRVLRIGTCARNGTFWGDVTASYTMINVAVVEVRDTVRFAGNSTSPTSTLWFVGTGHADQSCWPDHPGEVGWHFYTLGVILTKLSRSSLAECLHGQLELDRVWMLVSCRSPRLSAIHSLSPYEIAGEPWKLPGKRIEMPLRAGWGRGKTLWKRARSHNRPGTRSQACVMPSIWTAD
jgi:hypothetical protein